MSNTIEIQTEAISDSLTINPGKAVIAGSEMLNGTASDNDTETFYKAARCIVEPRFSNDDAQEDYQEFMDNDPENWVGFIKNNFGEDWGFIAQVVTEYGY